MTEETQRRLTDPTGVAAVNGHATWSATDRDRGGPPRPPTPSASRWAGGARGLIITRWRWIALIVLTVVVSAAALSWSRSPTYVAGADVLVQPQIFGKSATPVEPDMGTELALAGSTAVRDIAASRLHVDPAGLTGLSASVPLNTHVVHFGYAAGSARDAMLSAQAFADAYVAYQTAQARAIGTRNLAPTVITPAAEPSGPSSPNHEVDIAIAALVGVVLGLAAAWLRDRFDDRPRSSADLEHGTGVPTLAVIPRVQARGHDLADGLVVLDRPGSTATAAYQDLRRVIRRIASQDNAKTLLVTGVRSDEHLPVAADLAICLVQSYRRVILVDLHSGGKLSAALRRDPAADDLADMSGNGANAEIALQDTIVPGLRLLALGPEHTATDDTGLRRVFRQLRAAADFVVIAGPNPLTAEIGALADLADLTLVVVDSRRSTRTQVRGALGRLDQFENCVIGTVLTGHGRKTDARNTSDPPASDPPPTGDKITDQTPKEA